MSNQAYICFTRLQWRGMGWLQQWRHKLFCFVPRLGPSPQHLLLCLVYYWITNTHCRPLPPLKTQRAWPQVTKTIPSFRIGGERCVTTCNLSRLEIFQNVVFAQGFMTFKFYLLESLRWKICDMSLKETLLELFDNLLVISARIIICIPSWMEFSYQVLSFEVLDEIPHSRKSEPRSLSSRIADFKSKHFLESLLPQMVRSNFRFQTSTPLNKKSCTKLLCIILVAFLTSTQRPELESNQSHSTHLSTKKKEDKHVDSKKYYKIFNDKEYLKQTFLFTHRKKNQPTLQNTIW